MPASHFVVSVAEFTIEDFLLATKMRVYTPRLLSFLPDLLLTFVLVLDRDARAQPLFDLVILQMSSS